MDDSHTVREQNVIQNPFVAGLPVRGEDFFGRKDILNEVLLFLKKESDVSFLIYGQRRIGKTSLLIKIKTNAEVLENACPFYYNLQASYHTPLKQLLYDIADNIDRQTRLGLNMKKENFTGADADAYRYFQEVFIPRVIDKLPSNRSLLLLFDETDVMTSKKDEDDDSIPDTFASKAFIPFFADLIEYIHEKKYPVKFIFAIGREYKDPAQKRFAHIAGYGSEMEIPYFTKKETGSLIKELSDTYIPFKEDAIDSIYDLTSGHPLFTQCLADASFDAARKNREKQITPDIVKQQLMTTIKRYSIAVFRIWSSLAVNERVILFLIAGIKEENKPINIETIQKKAAALDITINVRNLHETLKRLKSYKFLKKTHRPGDEYDFYVEFIRKWIVNEVSGKDFASKENGKGKYEI